MRQWRVGTLSMGLSLIIMGTLLFISGANGKEFMNLFLAWWPLIFILLGIEILIYLFLSKREETFVKYDIFSILFVGVLGTICIGFAVLTTFGIVEEARGALHSVVRTYDLPQVEREIPDSIKRVVVQKGYKPIEIEKTKENEMLFFGTYRAASEEKKEGSNLMAQDDVISVHISGDTMYISIKDLPEERGFDTYYQQMNATLVLPEGVTVSVKDEM